MPENTVFVCKAVSIIFAFNKQTIKGIEHKRNPSDQDDLQISPEDNNLWTMPIFFCTFPCKTQMVQALSEDDECSKRYSEETNHVK
jgi:hypothetical protein